ncbi:hypothetical protein KCP74_06025 [Salmonella enterica subsp. enterica]|nr:hypothetical protein KCP74_06025 [Salmonella enterica subsp. enterica]
MGICSTSVFSCLVALSLSAWRGVLAWFVAVDYLGVLLVRVVRLLGCLCATAVIRRAQVP